MLDIKTCFTYAYSLGTFADFIQTVTAEAKSTNVIDLDAANLNIVGSSKPPWLIVKVGSVDFATCVSMEIKLLTASAANLTTNAKEVLMFRFARATMVAGALLVNIPLPNFKYLQYLGLEFTPFTSATAGGFLAYLSDGPEPAVAAPDNVEAGS